MRGPVFSFAFSDQFLQKGFSIFVRQKKEQLPTWASQLLVGALLKISFEMF